MNTNIIKVVVGEPKVTHLVHESVLSRCSFFEKCLTSGMREQEEKVVNLPEDDPNGFAVIVEWLYAGTIAKDLDNWTLAYAYIAADKYAMPKLQNTIMDFIRQRRKRNLRINPLWVLKIWKQTIAHSPLRDLAFDQLRWDVSRYRDYYIENSDKDRYSKEMQKLMKNADFGLALVHGPTGDDRWKQTNSSWNEGCFYHVHQDGEICEQEQPVIDFKI